MVKIDPYKTKERYLAWKEKTKDEIPEINKLNSDIIKEYLQDMENGINVSNLVKKGSRSFIRLNVLRQRIVFIAKEFEKRFGLKVMTGVS
ncbi:MAG: hypothetical protein ABIE22_02290, partial [archaeon]